MTSEPKADDGRIRLVFELTRAEHPVLYADLARFSKGTRRINRLRLLAYDGLLAQQGMQLRPATGTSDRNPAPQGDPGAEPALTNQLFAPGLAK